MKQIEIEVTYLPQTFIIKVEDEYVEGKDINNMDMTDIIEDYEDEIGQAQADEPLYEDTTRILRILKWKK